MRWLKAFWYKFLLGAKQPWADTVLDEAGQLQVRDYNHAFVTDLLTKLPEDSTRMLTSKGVVNLWVARYNHEHTEPKLEVLHSGIEADGRIRMKLDWNDAFIKMLAERGIFGETEEEAVQNYLMQVGRVVNADEHALVEAAPTFEPTEDEIARELSSMSPTMAAKLERALSKRKVVSAPRERSIDK
jgi:hypothetical protein